MTYLIKHKLTTCNQSRVTPLYHIKLTQEEAKTLLPKVKAIADGIDPVEARTYFFDTEGYMVSDNIAISYFINTRK